MSIAKKTVDHAGGVAAFKGSAPYFMPKVFMFPSLSAWGEANLDRASQETYHC